MASYQLTGGRKISSTKGTSAELSDFVEDRLNKKRFKSWNTIVRQGHEQSTLYYLSQAVLGEFWVLSNSKRVLINKLKNRSLFGHETFDSSKDFFTSYVTLTDSIIYSGDKTNLDDFWHKYPNEFRVWTRSMGTDKSGLYRKFDQYLCFNLHERMAIELLVFPECLGQ